MKNTIPFWLAVTITVIVSLPFGMLLGNYVIALWASFIVWAQYFNYGAEPKAAARVIFPCTIGGAFFGFLGMSLNTMVAPMIPESLAQNGLVSVAITLGFAVAIMVYLMEKVKIFGEGSLSYFNGLSIFLGIYFTGSMPKLDSESALLAVFMAFIWTLVSGYFGYILAWFNLKITFPKKIEE